jgi:glyoxylase I family protein
MIGGIHHLGLTVRDVDASAAWYVDVLGFRRVGEFESPDGARRKVHLCHDNLQARLGLTQHRGGQEVFDETRVGLDHLVFAVADRAELDAWSTRLVAAAVVHSPVAPANSIPGAAVLVFRDPDNIQLELSSIHPAGWPTAASRGRSLTRSGRRRRRPLFRNHVGRAARLVTKHRGGR